MVIALSLFCCAKAGERTQRGMVKRVDGAGAKGWFVARGFSAALYGEYGRWGIGDVD